MNDARGLVREKARALPASGPVPSPCNAVCRMDARSGLCAGCLRTLDEIAAWGGLDEAQRRAVWARLQERAGGEP